MHTCKRRRCVYAVATNVSEIRAYFCGVVSQQARFSVTVRVAVSAPSKKNKKPGPAAFLAAEESLQQERLSDLKLCWDLFADATAQTKSGSLNSDSV